MYQIDNPDFLVTYYPVRTLTRVLDIKKRDLRFILYGKVKESNQMDLTDLDIRFQKQTNGLLFRQDVVPLREFDEYIQFSFLDDTIRSSLNEKFNLRVFSQTKLN